MADPIVDTPPTGDTPAGTPPASPDPVQDLKDQIEREKARAATALKDKDAAEVNARNEKIARINAERKLKAVAGGEGETPAEAQGSMDHEEEIERLKAEKGVVNLLMLNPVYQDLIKKDQTLREVLQNNPLSLISEYIDADDAVDQIKKKLDAYKVTPTTPEQPKETPKSGDVPPVKGSVEMKGTITPEQAAKMSPQEWAKLPRETRQNILAGKY